MIPQKFKLWLPVICFAAYVLIPLNKWIILITSIKDGNQCPDAEKYIVNLAFLIFYLAFFNVLLLAFITWMKLFFKHSFANFMVEIVTIFVIFYHTYPVIVEVIRRTSQKSMESKCIDVFMTNSLRVHVYLIFGYLAALLIRILLWKQNSKLH